MTSLVNPTYTVTTLAKVEILDNHMSVLCTFGISTKDEELDLPLLYWISKLHKCPYKHRWRYITCQMLHETSFQIINIYSTRGQKRASELLWLLLLMGWCESNMDSEELLKVSPPAIA